MVLKQVLFVFDSNESVGFGHQARCERLAQALKKEGYSATCLGDINFESSYFQKIIKCKWKTQEAYYENMPISSRENQYNAVVIDMRNRNHSKNNLHRLIVYFEQMQKDTPRIIIDEAGKNSLFKGSIKAKIKSKEPAIIIIPYYTKNKPKYDFIKGSKVFIGSEYALIDEDYRKMRMKRVGTKYKKKEKNISVLVSFGRSAMGIKQARECIEALKEINIISSTIYANLEKCDTTNIKELAGNSKKVINVGFRNHMPTLLDNITIAIVGSGTIRYETCALGIPTLSFVQLENHSQSIKEFEDEGLCKNGGKIYEMSRNEIIKSIKDFVKDEEKLEIIHENCLKSSRLEIKGIHQIKEELQEIDKES